MSQFNPHRKALIRQAIAARPGYNATTMTLQPSFLMIAVLLINGTAQYVFRHKSNSTQRIPQERLLNENDSFVASDYGIMLITEDQTTPGIGVLQTAPSTFSFPAQSGGLQPAHLEAIYNGSLSLRVDDKVYADAIPTWPCRVVGTDQATEHRAVEGLTPFEPTVTIDGSKKTDIVLNIPSFSGSKIQYNTTGEGAVSKQVYAVLWLDGFLITGASNLGNLSSL